MPVGVSLHPHTLRHALMLKAELPVYLPVHSALFLLAAAVCLPFQDSQVSPGELGIFTDPLAL